MSKLNLIPTVPLDDNGEALAPKLTRNIFNEKSFYTKPNYVYVSEEVTSEGVSVAINLFDKDITNYVEFDSNLVLRINDISPQFTGVTTSTFGDSVVGLSTFSLFNGTNPLFKTQILSSNILSSLSEEIQISKVNHDFSTGEEILYDYLTTPIEIESVDIVGIGVTTILPSSLYAIKDSASVFKIARTEQDALSGIALTFSSVGAGTTHFFYSTNSNTRSTILIDGIIQSPLSRKNKSVGFGTTSVGISTTIISISGISSLSSSDFLLSNNEYLQITGISTSDSTVTVNRGSMGTVAVAHTDGDAVKVYSGDYNIVKDSIHFSSPPLQNYSFQGRVFYKKLYDKNFIFDDISDQFIGIGKTFTVTSDFNNVGLTTSNTSGIQYGVLLVNNVFQKPGVDYDLTYTSGITTVTFTGNNVENLPRAGKILSFDFYEGAGYQPLVAAAATVSVDGSGQIDNVYLNGTGSGYLTEPDIHIYSSVGSGATITALLGTGDSVGFITGLSITNAGSGYTSTSLPIIDIDPPYGYKNIQLDYNGASSGVGTQATADLIVGVGGSITSLKINNTGIGYSTGDVLTLSGIGTTSGYSPLTLTVKEIENDTFDFWTFGKILRLKTNNVPNGSRTVFPLLNFENDLAINFQNNSLDSRYNIKNNLLVFVNDVLQLPTNYSLSGNNLILDTAPSNGSNLYVYIYVASDEDSVDTLVEETIKVGDSLQLDNQNLRNVTEILSRTSVRTPNYISIGIDSNLSNLRLTDWTKQTRDLTIRGIDFYKSRNSYSPLIRPSSRLIAGIGTTSQSIYVENTYLFDYDGIVERETSVQLVNDIPLLKAQAGVVVSTAGTVSSISLTNGGSGYSQLNPPSVIITDKQVTKQVIGRTWNLVDNDSTISYNKSISQDSVTVSVGQSLSVRTSYNLVGFYSTTISIGTTSLNSVSYGNGIWIVSGENAFISTSTNLTSWNPVGFATVIGDSIPEDISTISFAENLNDIAYDDMDGRFVVVSDGGQILTYETKNTESIGRYQNNLILRNSGISENLNSVIFDNIFDVGEGASKQQYVSVGNSATILVSASSINNELVGTPGIVWQIRMSDAISSTGLSGETLNDIVYTGIGSLPFLVIGNNGLVVKFPNNRFDPGDFSIVSAFTSENLKSIIYDQNNERAIVVGSSGTVFGSYRTSSFEIWEPISVGSTNFNDITYSEYNQKYLIVGDGESYTSAYETVGAAATAVVSAGGTISSIVISNGGLFYDTNSSNYPSVIIASPDLVSERFNSCKIIGDHGVISGVSTTSGISTTTPAIQFEIEVDPGLSLVESQIQTGDYFVAYRTNIGSGVTSIETDGSIVGIATTFIDCVYKADQVVKSGTGIVTVTSNVLSIDGLLSIPSIFEYGIYSWGKIYDFDSRTSPSIFEAETLRGSSGLSTSPKALRITSIGSTTLPRNA